MSQKEQVVSKEDNKNECESEEIGEFKRLVGGKCMKSGLGKAELMSRLIKVAEQVLEAQKERDGLLHYTSTVDNSEPVISEHIERKSCQALARLNATESASDRLKATKSPCGIQPFLPCSQCLTV